MFEVVTKLVVVTQAATTEEETKRQRLGQQLEALLQNVHGLSFPIHMLVQLASENPGIIGCMWHIVNPDRKAGNYTYHSYLAFVRGTSELQAW